MHSSWQSNITTKPCCFVIQFESQKKIGAFKNVIESDLSLDQVRTEFELSLSRTKPEFQLCQSTWHIRRHSMNTPG